MPETDEVTTTPAAADNVFAALYHLTGITYIDGVTFDTDPRGRERAIKALKHSKEYCDKALAQLGADTDNG